MPRGLLSISVGFTADLPATFTNYTVAFIQSVFTGSEVIHIGLTGHGIRTEHRFPLATDTTVLHPPLSGTRVCEGSLWDFSRFPHDRVNLADSHFFLSERG